MSEKNLPGSDLIGSNIKSLLLRKHKTQAELAQYMRCSRWSVYAIVSGRTQLQFVDALEIAEFLGCSVYDFVRQPK